MLLCGLHHAKHIAVIDDAGLFFESIYNVERPYIGVLVFLFHFRFNFISII